MYPRFLASFNTLDFEDRQSRKPAFLCGCAVGRVQADRNALSGIDPRASCVGGKAQREYGTPPIAAALGLHGRAVVTPEPDEHAASSPGPSNTFDVRKRRPSRCTLRRQ